MAQAVQLIEPAELEKVSVGHRLQTAVDAVRAAASSWREPAGHRPSSSSRSASARTMREKNRL